MKTKIDAARKEYRAWRKKIASNKDFDSFDKSVKKTIFAKGLTGMAKKYELPTDALVKR